MKRKLISPKSHSRITAGLCAAAALLCVSNFAQTIPNPSFETDTFSTFPGYISGNAPITGWTGSPADRVGLNPAGGSPFADNGAKPDGNNVAFIQSNVTDTNNPSRLSTTITGLSIGTTYKVTFRVNARTGNTPNVKVYIDNVAVLLPGGPDGFSTADVGGSNPYWYVAFQFTAAAASQTLAIVNDATGDQTLLVDDFKIAPSSGRWSIDAWNGDFDSGIDVSYLYTHAYNFGSSASPVINGVTFTGVPGGSPSVAGRFSTTYLGNLFTGDQNNIFDASAIMATDFVYGGNVPAGLYQSITLQGLTPGTEYVMTVYSCGWEDPSVGSRWGTWSVGNDYQTLNQDQFSNNYGIRMSYRYIADASGTVTMKFSPFVPVNVSFHIYGFSNREAVSRFAAPIFTAQPAGAIVSPGVPVSFSVAVSALPQPTYQWRLNGADILNATDATYSLPAVTSLDAGAYDVVASNLVGKATSTVARVTVGMPITNPSFEADAFFGWPGYVSGNTPITAWTSLPNHGINPVLGSPANGPNPFADNGTVPNGTQVAFMQGDGALSQVVSGFTSGGQYFLHYFENARTVTTIPALEAKVAGSTVVPAHSVIPVGGGSSYYEIFSDVFVAGSTDVEISFVKSAPQGGDCTALLDNVAIVPIPAGTRPSIGMQPRSTTVYVGEPASFSAVAQGSLPLFYQWLLNGNPVPNATNATLSIAAVRLPDEGNYTLVVTNSSGSVTSAVARLALLEAIPSLRNTGIDASGAPLPGGAVDPFWTLPVNPDGGGTVVYVGNDGWPIQAGVWMPNDSVSKWVGTRPAVGAADIPVGNYSYRTTFDLTGRDTNTVTITGRWATDNSGTAVFVNGTTVNVPLANGFDHWINFTIDTSLANFLPGTNVLEFGVNNAGTPGPSGLRLEFTRASARTLPGIPAGIGSQSAGGLYAEGDTVVLNVIATGTLPITYQWSKDGLNLAGATDSSLMLSGVTTNDSGHYRVAVTNNWGFAISSDIVVTIAYRPIPGIFGTGLAANGSLLGDGDVDPHYILSVSADANFPGPAAYAISNVWPIVAGTWLVNGPNSRWIGPSAAQNEAADPTQGNAEGLYTYQTSFNLTGYDISKVHLVGGWAVDNTGLDILVNGATTGNTCLGFGSLTSFTINSGLIAGVNTLDFIVTNAPVTPNPTGLRVDLKGYLDILPSQVKMSISVNGSNLSISWTGAAPGQKLQWATDLGGPWNDITSPPNPYTTTATGTRKFFRIAQ